MMNPPSFLQWSPRMVAGLVSALGSARWLSLALGTALVLMGLVNLKELVWFKRGVSLMIPDSGSTRERAVAYRARTPWPNR